MDFLRLRALLDSLVSMLFRNSETVDMDWFYANSKNKFGDKRVDTYLHNHAIQSDYIKAFLNSVSHSAIQNRRSIEPPTLEELIGAAREKRSGFRSRGLAGITMDV
jgi:hypothetical protein